MVKRGLELEILQAHIELMLTGLAKITFPANFLALGSELLEKFISFIYIHQSLFPYGTYPNITLHLSKGSNE